MDLQFGRTHQDLRSRRDVLQALQSVKELWGRRISGFIRTQGLCAAINSMDDKVTVDGKPLKSYFEKAIEFMNLITVLKKLLDIDPQEAREVLEDTIAMVSLIAVIYGDFKQWIQGDNAERSWHQLLRDAGLLREEALSSYERHKDIYDAIVEAIELLLPENVRICIEIAAAITSFIWPYRHAIADWICQNKDLLVRIGTGLAVGSLLALAAYAIYFILNIICGAVTSGTKKKKKK